MNLNEVQDFIKQMNPNRNIIFDFDKNCIRTIELTLTDGVINEMFHVEYNQVKVMVDNENPTYAKIKPHRAVFHKNDLQNYLQ